MVSFNDVKEKVSFPDAVKLLSLNLTERDGIYRGKCPACNAGRDRALVITPGKGFYCFQAKKGGDVIALAAHIRGIPVKEAAEFLVGEGTGKPVGQPAPGTPPPLGLKPLAHLEHQHERVQAIISEETAIQLGVGYTNKGIMRGTVAVPIHDPVGTLIAYVGIEEDGFYRFPAGFLPTQHLFNAHRVLGGEVHIVPTVEDVLRAYDQGIIDCVCFLRVTIAPGQLRLLADWLDAGERVGVV